MRLADIAEALEISVGYASSLLRDPLGEQRRERRRGEPPAPRQAGEFDPDDMAWLVSVSVGFVVDRKAVMAAGRRGAITSRRGPNGVPLFHGEKVLSEIDAGAWRPHRSRDDAGLPLRGQPVPPQECANPRCTKGEAGRPASREIPRSHRRRLVEAWTCSKACSEAIGGKERRPERRDCGCLLDDGTPCPNRVRLTRHQKRTDTGPRICEECRREGRKTEAQKAAARAALDANRQTEAAKRHQSAQGKKQGQQNASDPEHLESWISAGMERHAARKRERRAAIEAALDAEPALTDKVHARRLQTSPALVARVRYELGVPLPSGRPQKPPKPNYVRQVREAETGRLVRVVVEPLEGECEYTPVIREYVRQGPNRRSQEPNQDALERALSVAWMTEDGRTSEEIAEALGVTPESVRRIRKKVRARGQGGRPRKPVSDGGR